MAVLCMVANGFSMKWSFALIPSDDQSNMAADEHWYYNSSKTRYGYTLAVDNNYLYANGQPLQISHDIRFSFGASSEGNVRFGYKSSMWVADGTVFTIENLEAGDTIQVVYQTSSSGNSRQLVPTNVTSSEFVKSSSEVVANGRVTADGSVSFTASGALYIKGILAGKVEHKDNPTDDTRGIDYMQPTAIATAALGNGPAIWLAPDGNDATGDGTEQAPYYHLQVAVDKAQPGTVIYMKAGTYQYSERVNIDECNGTHDQYITVMCPDGRAVLDFSTMPYHKHSDNPQQGVRLTSSYWHFYKIDICNASDNGMLIERNKPENGSNSDIVTRTQDAHDNIIEFCNFYRNGDTGLQMKNLGAFNYVLNCDSYENKDEEDGDADGFAPKISVGDGNYFYGCRAYNNSDDGYDVFFKKDGGFDDNVTIVFENCLAYENGFINGVATQGNMNGFKCGSDQGRMNVVLNRCLAVNNGAKGFDQNHNSGDIIMNNCTGYALKSFGEKPYSYRIFEKLAEGSVVELTNCIAINDNLKTDKATDGEDDHGKRSEKYGRVEVTVGTLTTTDLSVDPSHVQSEDNFADLIAPRLEDGTLPWMQTTWGHPVEGDALLVDKGTLVPANQRYAQTGVGVPAIEYAGEAPDLGAFEFGLTDKTVSAFGNEETGIRQTATNGTEKCIRVVRAFCGLSVVSVEGATASDRFQLYAYSIDGKLLVAKSFQGTNTSISLPDNQPFVLKVTGRNFSGEKTFAPKNTRR